MRNSGRVFRRDVGRLFRVRKAWIIVIGVLVTPALYAWFNINAFWDPYANTQSIQVAVVNLDEGATSDLTGDLDVGAQVVDQLEENDQLGWTFMDEDEAQHAVRSGDVYAAIVIPTDFSSDLISITTGEFTQPALQYYVNEKAGAIAPKITDVGASQLDRQITEAFTEQVADAATTAISDAGESIELRLLDAKDGTLTAFDEVSESIASAREKLADLRTGISGSRTALESVSGTLDDVDTMLEDARTAITEATTLIAEAQQDIVTFTDAATSAYVDAATQLADAAADANVSVTELSQTIQQAGVQVDGAITDVTAAVEANGEAIAQLQQLVDGADLDPDVEQRLTEVISALQERNTTDQQLLEDLGAITDSTSSTVQSIADASSALADATKNAQTSATDLRALLTDTVPALNSAMSSLSASAASFSSALTAQQTQLGAAQQLLTDLDAQLVSTDAAVGSFDDDLAAIESDLGTARTDVLALSGAEAWNQLAALTGLDAEQIAAFISSPVEISQQVLFPVDTYGSAMAALFTNLSLWIGAFVLMVIFKIEVDTEGIERLTVTQAYMGRFALFGSLAVGQALIVSIGNLVIGIQTVNALAYVGTAVLVSLAYMSIVYALCVAFGHVGRGLCILLVIMQIPGASGLYPIEMMPDFFRAIYPFLPFTYGIDAMRETIAGFYGAHYWQYLGVLAIFVAVAFLLGIVLRRGLSNLHLLFNRRIAETDLLIGEKIQVGGRGYRLSDVIHAMNDRDEYREELERRAVPFTRRYPTLLRVTLLIGAAGLAVLAALAWLMPGGKATMLAIAVGWMLLFMGALVTLEYIRHSFARAGEIAALNDAELRDVVLAGGHRRESVDAVAATRVLPVADAAAVDAEAETARIAVLDDEAPTERIATADDDVLAWLFRDDSPEDPEEPVSDDPTDDTGADDDAPAEGDADGPDTDADEHPADDGDEQGGDAPQGGDEEEDDDQDGGDQK